MFCPNCGQEVISQETSFCSRCGFLLTGTYNLIQTGGVMPELSTNNSPRRRSPRDRGIRQGLFIFLLSFLVVPITLMVTLAMNARPLAVVISMFLFFIGGLLRMAFAALFEESYSLAPAGAGDFLSAAEVHLKRSVALPPPQLIPATPYAAPKTGSWRDTNDLQPVSVVEGTTKLLQEDELI